MTKRTIFLFGFILLIIVTLIFSLFVRQAQITQRNLTQKHFFSDSSNIVYQSEFNWDELHKGIVSGAVAEKPYLKNGKYYIPVRVNSDGMSIVINTYIEESKTGISTLKLENGEFSRIQEWRGLEFSELSKYLVPGWPTVVYVNITKDEFDQYKSQVAQSGSETRLELGPILNLIVGDFSK